MDKFQDNYIIKNPNSLLLKFALSVSRHSCCYNHSHPCTTISKAGGFIFMTLYLGRKIFPVKFLTDFPLLSLSRTVLQTQAKTNHC